MLPAGHESIGQLIRINEMSGQFEMGDLPVLQQMPMFLSVFSDEGAFTDIAATPPTGPVPEVR